MAVAGAVWSGAGCGLACIPPSLRLPAPTLAVSGGRHTGQLLALPIVEFPASEERAGADQCPGASSAAHRSGKHQADGLRLAGLRFDLRQAGRDQVPRPPFIVGHFAVQVGLAASRILPESTMMAFDPVLVTLP